MGFKRGFPNLHYPSELVEKAGGNKRRRAEKFPLELSERHIKAGGGIIDGNK